LSATDLGNLDEVAKSEVKTLLRSHVEYQDYFSKPILDVENKFKLIFDSNLNRLDDVCVPMYYMNLPPEDKFEVTGLMDLVIEEDEQTINIVDFKTGKTKSENALKKEIQPQIYYVAATLLYPKYEHIILTFDYIKDQPRIITFHKEDVDLILEKVYNRHLQILANNKPRRPSREFWACSYCLTQGKSAYNGLCKELYEKHLGQQS
jgi:hypothetical protein